MRIAHNERSIGALLVSLLTIGILVGAFVGPWFEYDFNSGRKTPPGGPQPEDLTMEETAYLDFYATHWEGDVEPADAALAEKAVTLMETGIYVIGGLLALVALGELPVLSRVIRRPVSLVLAGAATIGAIAVTVLAWHWLPDSLAGYGVDSQYTAHLVEPDGYTRTTLAWGYYAMALTMPAAIAVFLFKFQAGTADPRALERLTAQE